MASTEVNAAELSASIAEETVTAVNSYTLSANTENLILTGGITYDVKLDNTIATVYGTPEKWGYYLDYYQGDNSYGYNCDCGVVASENMLIQMGILDFKIDYNACSSNIDTLESLLVEYAKEANLIDSSNSNPSYNGGISIRTGVTSLLENYGLEATVKIKTLEDIGEYIKDNYSIIASVDAYVLWGYTENFSGINHAVLITGVAYDSNNNILGFYICDSGELSKSNASRYVSYSLLDEAFGGYTVISDDASKLYLDDINGTGNSLDNNLIGNYGNNILSGLEGNDSISGGYGKDSLLGGEGNDTLNGGLGNDYMAGGSGNDTYIVDSSKDVILENKNYTTKDGLFVDNGNDTIILDADYITNSNLSDESTLIYTLANNIENLDLSNITTTSLITKGNNLNNTIIGGEGNNTIYGYAGDDSITCKDGDNYLDGGLGNDTLVGGDGNNTYIIDNINDIVINSNGNSVSSIVLSNLFSGNTLDLEVLNYNNIENIDASAVKRGLYINTSDGFSNITGSDFDDTITVGKISETLDGGSGNDLYILDDLSNAYINDSKGIDTIKLTKNYTKSSYTLNDNIEIFDASSSEKTLSLTGNTLSDTIIGNSYDDTISGGDDKLTDKLYGEAGNDTYLLFDNDKAFESANNGTDTIILDSTYEGNFYSLNKTNIEILDASNTSLNHIFYGSENSDTIFGGSGQDNISTGAGNDYIEGGLGNDTLRGGVGNDIYIFDAQLSDFDTIIESKSEDDFNIISLSDTNTSNVLIYKNEDGHYIIDYGLTAETNTIDLGDTLNIEKIQLTNSENTITNYITTPEINEIINKMSTYNILDTNSSYATLADVVSQKAMETTLVSWQ